MKQEDGKAFTAYQIDNIHDSNVRYLFCNVEDFNSMFSKLVEHFDFGKNHVRVLITKAGVEVQKKKNIKDDLEIYWRVKYIVKIFLCSLPPISTAPFSPLPFIQKMTASTTFPFIK